MAIIDMSIYESDPEKMTRINFINAGLEARLKFNLNNRDLILKHIAGGLMESINPSINLVELSNEELDWIVKTIAGALDFSNIEAHVDQMLDLCTRFKTADYSSRASIVEEIKYATAALQNEFRKTQTMTQGSDYFCLRDGIFEERVATAYNAFKNPSHMLRSGMQGLNSMLHGGFESTRVYTFLGLPGEGKSLMLLNLAYQIKIANTTYRPKDPTKRPCVVYLTMENMDRESISRLYNISTANGYLTDKSLEDTLYDMRTYGMLRLDTPTDMDIIIKYKPDSSCDTSYLYDLTDELEEDGYEVCCLIQDYIKKIRPVNYTGEPYNDLGNVIAEFKNYAILQDVPVITASQCNREAAKIIDQKRRINAVDLVRQLGRDNAGESIQVINNSDAVMMLTPEYDAEHNKYLGVNLAKRRYNNTYSETLNYMFLPFAQNNGIRLVMDFNLPTPLYRVTMSNAPGIETQNQATLQMKTGMVGSAYLSNNAIIDRTKMTPPEIESAPHSSNVFDTAYNVNTVPVSQPSSHRVMPFYFGERVS